MQVLHDCSEVFAKNNLLANPIWIYNRYLVFVAPLPHPYPDTLFLHLIGAISRNRIYIGNRLPIHSLISKPRKFVFNITCSECTQFDLTCNKQTVMSKPNVEGNKEDCFTRWPWPNMTDLCNCRTWSYRTSDARLLNLIQCLNLSLTIYFKKALFF